MAKDDEGGLHYIDFNQEYSCIAFGSPTGFKIYNCLPFEKCFGKREPGVGIVKMLFRTSLLTLVGKGDQPTLSPRHLRVYNTKRQTTICEVKFASTILAVVLNRSRMAVVLEDKIHLLDMRNLDVTHTISADSMVPNPRGLCALSPSNDNCYLAVPGSAPGDVRIFDAINIQIVIVIKAHKSGLGGLQFNSDGTLLATASEKGTVIRVWNIPDGAKQYEFRRGTYEAMIYSMAFDVKSTMLCVSSNMGTIHVFRLAAPPPTAASGMFGWVSSVMPTAVTSMWEPQRDFASIRLDKELAGVPNMCGINTEAGKVFVLIANGIFLRYDINLETGGECAFDRKYNLLEQSDDEGDVPATPAGSAHTTQAF